MAKEKPTKPGFYDGMDDRLKQNVRISVVEASLSTVMGTFIGGAFLIGFALLLGAGDFEIGLLSSLPLFANLLQIAGSFIIMKVGSRKKICVLFLFLHRLMWTMITLLPLFVFRDQLDDIRIWIFLVLLTGASICASMTGVAWTSWVSDLVPKGIRGRFFSRRNMVAQITGMVLAVAAGRFIDMWKTNWPDTVMQSYGFMILFGIGVLFGIVGVILFSKLHEPPLETQTGESFLKQLVKPFTDSKFRMFMVYKIAWGFSTGIVGPFFSVYMINTLQVPFSMITLFGVMAGLFSIAGLKFWGGLIDKIGPKTLAVVCGIGGSFVPFLWIFATPDNYSVIWLSNAVSGFFFAGIGLSATGLLMNLAPAKNNAVYFAVFAAVTGLFGAFAPIAGGSLGEFFRGRVLYEGVISLSDIRLLFVLSTLLRLLSLSLLSLIRIDESVSIKDLFASLSKVQTVLPLYQVNNFASYGMQAVENATFNLSRSVVGVEQLLERLLQLGGDMGQSVLFKAKAIDETIDRSLTRHEDALERILDRIIRFFKRNGSS